MGPGPGVTPPAPGPKSSGKWGYKRSPVTVEGGEVGAVLPCPVSHLLAETLLVRGRTPGLGRRTAGDRPPLGPPTDGEPRVIGAAVGLALQGPTG